MDSHGSDDSETFTTPPASIIAGNDTESLNVELPEGEEAMEEEQADQEWKSIMPEVVVLKAILSLLDSLHVRAQPHPDICLLTRFNAVQWLASDLL